MTHRTRIALSLLLGLFCFTGLGCEKPAIQTAQPATASIATVPVKPVKALRKPWAHANSDLTPDPRITFGELDNGLRYILHPNPKPADRVYIRLVVETGSMNESDDQQGLAHFLEHMAFNGSKNFAPSEMVSHFQRLGMAFGRDINAYTSFDVTAYNIDLPNSTPKMLNEGMTLMRDYAGDLLVLQTEIDRERGVILSEMRDAMTPEYLDSKAIFNFVAPNTPLSTRWPLGKSETVSKMNRPLFKKYINDFYTADRMTLVVTGDIEPKAIAAEIDKHFGDLKNNTVPNAELTYRPGPAVKAAANVDAKLSMTEVSLMCLKPFDKTPDSVAAQIEGFRRRCALAMVNQRLSQTALDDKKILDLEASWYPFIGYCDLADLTAEGKAEDIDHLVKTLDTSIRQAITYGFTDQDITAAKARMLQNLEKLVEADPTRKSGPMADQYTKSVGEKYVLTSAATDLAMARTAFAKFNNDDVKALLNKLFTTGEFRLFISTNKPVNAANVLKQYQAGTKVAVKDPRKKGAKSFAYTKFGKRGKVVATAPADKTVAKNAKALGISMLRFKNNTRLNIKPTDFEKGRVGVVVRFGNGLLSLPKNKPGLTLFTAMTYDTGGLAKHKVMDIQQLLAGKSVSSNFSIDEDSFVLSGSTDAKNILTQMQLMCAYLTDPGFHDEALRQMQIAVPMQFAQLKTDPEGTLQTQVMPLIHNDYRFAFPTQKQVLSRTVAESRAWLAKAQKRGYLEISVVGDVQPQAVIDAVAKTFGALGKRAATKTPHPAQSTIQTNSTLAGKMRSFRYQGTKSKSFALVTWPLAEGDDYKQTRCQSILSRIFSDRVMKKIREELGLAYSPYIMARSSSVFPKNGYYMGVLGTSPETAKQVADIVRTMGQDLADKGVTDDEFKQAIKPTLESIKTYRKTNAYWLQSVLPDSSLQPWRLDASLDMTKFYQSMTKEMLVPVAKTYLQSSKAFRCMVLPSNYKPAAKPAATKTKKAA